MKALLISVFLLFFTLKSAWAGMLSVGNTTELDFNSLDTAEQITIVNASFDSFVTGEVVALLANSKWSDEKMADFTQRVGQSPQVIILAAFTPEKLPKFEEKRTIISAVLKSQEDTKQTLLEVETPKSNPLYQGDVELTKQGHSIQDLENVDIEKGSGSFKIVNLQDKQNKEAVSKSQQNKGDKQKANSNIGEESSALSLDEGDQVSLEKDAYETEEKQEQYEQRLAAEVFSTRAGYPILYLYLNGLADHEDNQELAVFFSENAQSWFEEQGLMVIPEVIYKQNLVTVELEEGKF